MDGATTSAVTAPDLPPMATAARKLTDAEKVAFSEKYYMVMVCSETLAGKENKKRVRPRDGKGRILKSAAYDETEAESIASEAFVKALAATHKAPFTGEHIYNTVKLAMLQDFKDRFDTFSTGQQHIAVTGDSMAIEAAINSGAPIPGVQWNRESKVIGLDGELERRDCAVLGDRVSRAVVVEAIDYDKTTTDIPAEDMELFQLHTVNKLTFAEIAAKYPKFGSNEAAVRQRYNRAKAEWHTGAVVTAEAAAVPTGSSLSREDELALRDKIDRANKENS